MSDVLSVKWGSRVGYCDWGIRQFFDRYGLDLKDFEENGIDEQVLRDTGSEFAMKAIRVAYERRG